MLNNDLAFWTNVVSLHYPVASCLHPGSPDGKFLFPLLLSSSLLLYSSSFYPPSLLFFLCRSFCICVGLLTQRQLVSLRAHSCIISNSFPSFFHLEHDGFATVKLVVFRNIGSIILLILAIILPGGELLTR